MIRPLLFLSDADRSKTIFWVNDLIHSLRGDVTTYSLAVVYIDKMLAMTTMDIEELELSIIISF